MPEEIQNQDQNKVPLLRKERLGEVVPSHYFSVWAGALILLIVGLTACYAVWASETHSWPFGIEETAMCTMEAKQCPDGSYVGRTGPACEFAACSPSPLQGEDRGEVDTSDWKTYRNEEYGFELSYPEDWSIFTSFDSPKPPVLMVKSPIVIPSETEPLYYVLSVSISDNQLKNSDGNLGTGEVVNIGGEKAIVSKDTIEEAISTSVFHNSKFYNLLFYPYQPKYPEWKSDEFEKIYLAILSSFKFIE